MPRRPSTDCAPYFTGTSFVLRPEKTGTELDQERVLNALNECLEGQVLTEEPLALTVDIQDCDPYLPPAVTLENQQFDLDALLRSILREQEYSLPVDLWGTIAALDADECADLLHVNEDGSLSLNRDLAAAKIADWAAEYDADRVPYYFSSYSAGKVTLPFAIVDCRLDKDAMLDRMEDALCNYLDAMLAQP